MPISFIVASTTRTLASATSRPARGYRIGSTGLAVRLEAIERTVDRREVLAARIAAVEEEELRVAVLRPVEEDAARRLAVAAGAAGLLVVGLQGSRACCSG